MRAATRKIDLRARPGAGLGRAALRGLVASLLLVTLAFAEDRPPQPEATAAIAPRQSVLGREMMVATANPLASETGFAVLEAGGTAADAAVAVQMMLNLVEPQSSGIGGGGFVVYWDAAARQLTTFDGRETAPLAAGPFYWIGPDGKPLGFWDAAAGGRSVGVPGTLKLMEVLHARFGRRPWPDLLQPAIDRAEAGFTISPRLAAAIADAKANRLADFPAASALFLHPDGSPREAGETLRNPALAATLRQIAAEGSAPFYHGPIARDIVAAVRGAANPGVMTPADLAIYRVIERPPVCMPYRAREVCGMGPPSSGALTVGQILGILAQFDLTAIGEGPQAWHLFIEASKLAFADRARYMADADFVDMPTEGLLDPRYLAARARAIDPLQAMGKATAGNPPWDRPEPLGSDRPRPRKGTTQFVIRDREGNLVSATTTIETGFGSRVMVDGFLLNNELTDFSFLPEEDGAPVANRVEPGKRPRSSMAPTIVLQDGEPMLATGSPGGANIIPFVAQALIGILDWNLDPQTAIDAPHVVNLNGKTRIEASPQAPALIAALTARGQVVETADLNSGLQAILIENGQLLGATDKRREGLVLSDEGR
ncbi:MAG: gamma-glutamyltransferase [Amaricoccus sp.]